MSELHIPSLTPSQRRAAAERRARARKIAARAHADTPIVCSKPLRPTLAAEVKNSAASAPVQAASLGVSIDGILAAVAQHFGIGRGKILSSSMQAHLTRPRHIAIYLTRQLLGYSPGRIAIAFKRDRTSALYAIRKIAEIADVGTTARDLAAIRALLAAPGDGQP